MSVCCAAHLLALALSQSPSGPECHTATFQWNPSHRRKSEVFFVRAESKLHSKFSLENVPRTYHGWGSCVFKPKSKARWPKSFIPVVTRSLSIRRKTQQGIHFLTDFSLIGVFSIWWGLFDFRGNHRWIIQDFTSQHEFSKTITENTYTIIRRLLVNEEQTEQNKRWDIQHARGGLTNFSYCLTWPDLNFYNNFSIYI